MKIHLLFAFLLAALLSQLHGESVGAEPLEKLDPIKVQHFTKSHSKA